MKAPVTIAFLVADLEAFRRMLDHSVQGTLTLEQRADLVPLLEELQTTLERLQHYGVGQ